MTDDVTRPAASGDDDERYDQLIKAAANREDASIDAFLAKGRHQYGAMFEAALARAERRGVTVDALYEHDRALIEQSLFPGPSCLQPQEVDLFTAGLLSPERTAHALQCQGCTVMIEGLRPSPELAARWVDEVRAAVSESYSASSAISIPESRWKTFRDGFSWQPALVGAAAAWLVVAAGVLTFRPRLNDLQAYRQVAETFVETEATSALLTDRQFRLLASSDPGSARSLIAQKLLEASHQESDRAAFRVTAARVASDVASPGALAALLQSKDGVSSSVFFERVYFDAAREACEQLPASTVGRDELLADFEKLRHAVFEAEDLSAWSKPYLAVHDRVESLLRLTAESTRATPTQTSGAPSNEPPNGATDTEAAARALRQCDAFLEKSASLRLAQFDPSLMRAMNKHVTAEGR